METLSDATWLRNPNTVLFGWLHSVKARFSPENCFSELKKRFQSLKAAELKLTAREYLLRKQCYRKN